MLRAVEAAIDDPAAASEGIGQANRAAALLARLQALT
jgi:hypothetical protein